MPVVQVCNFNSASVRSVDYLSACAERTERTNALTFVPLNDWLFPTKTDFRFTRNVATRVPFRRLTTSQPKRRRNEDDDNNQLPDSNIEDENRILSIRLLNNHTLDIVSFVSKPEDRVVDFAKQSRVFISTEQNAKFRTPFISRIEDNEQMEKIIKTLLNTWRVKTLHLILKKQSKFIERLLKENNCSLLTAKLRGYSITSTKLYSGNTNLSSTKPTAFATFAAATTNSITRLSQYTMLLLSKPLALFDDDANVVYSLAYLFGLHSIYDNLYGIRGDVLAKLTKKPQFNNIFYSKVGFLIVRLQTYIDNAQRRPTLITRFEQHCVFHMSNDTTCEENRTPCHEQVYYYLFDQRNELAFAIFITTNPLSAVSSVKQEIKLNEQAVSVVPSTSFLSLYSNEQHAAYPSLRGLFFPGDENARLLLPFDIKLYFNNCIQYQRNYYRRKYYNWLHYFCVTLQYLGGNFEKPLRAIIGRAFHLDKHHATYPVQFWQPHKQSVKTYTLQEFCNKISPIAETLQAEPQTPAAAGICYVCRSKQIDAILMPCTHMFSCYLCTKRVTNEHCPFCAKKIVQVERVYCA